MISHHPIETWTLYAHTFATQNTYTDSFMHVATMRSLEEWAAVWNNCHPDLVGDPEKCVHVNKHRILSWSLFRDDIQPKWEDPKNFGGSTLTSRTNIDEVDAKVVWRDIIFECIRGAIPQDILGVQVTQKPFRNTTLLKFDVWLRSNSDITHIRNVLKRLLQLDFTTSNRTMSLKKSTF